MEPRAQLDKSGTQIEFQAAFQRANFDPSPGAFPSQSRGGIDKLRCHACGTLRGNHVQLGDHAEHAARVNGGVFRKNNNANRLLQLEGDEAEFELPEPKDPTGSVIPQPIAVSLNKE